MADSEYTGGPQDWHRARALPGGGEDPRRRVIMRLMKFVLPAVALIFLALMVAWPRLFREESKFELTTSEISAVKDDLRMSSPRFTGMGADNRPYRVTADAAVQDLNDHELVRLEALQADLSLKDGSWLSVNAKDGLMHNGLQTLQLDGQIEAYSDFGYAFYTRKRTDRFECRFFIFGSSLSGYRAHTAICARKPCAPAERGQRLHFAGDVKVIIFPRSGGAG